MTTGANQPAASAPRTGDVIFLTNDVDFTYVGDQLRDAAGRFLPAKSLGDGCFEVTDMHGESFIVARASERDDELRSAVHDNGRRRAWRVNVTLRRFTDAEIAALG